MNMSFNGGLKQKIEPSNSPMVLAKPNPSQAEGFFFPMPTGDGNGDISYWNPNAGDGGAWVKLDAPVGSATTLQPESLNHNGEFLFWARGLPRGTAKNQMLYWDPAIGNDGAWVKLDAPSDSSPENPSSLKHNGDAIFWGDASGLPEGTNTGDLLRWDPSAGDGGAWVILEAKEESDEKMYVLTIKNGNLQWIETESCDEEDSA